MENWKEKLENPFAEEAKQIAAEETTEKIIEGRNAPRVITKKEIAILRRMLPDLKDENMDSLIGQDGNLMLGLIKSQCNLIVQKSLEKTRRDKPDRFNRLMKRRLYAESEFRNYFYFSDILSLEKCLREIKWRMAFSEALSPEDQERYHFFITDDIGGFALFTETNNLYPDRDIYFIPNSSGGIHPIVYETRVRPVDYASIIIEKETKYLVDVMTGSPFVPTPIMIPVLKGKSAKPPVAAQLGVKVIEIRNLELFEEDSKRFGYKNTLDKHI